MSKWTSFSNNKNNTNSQTASSSVNPALETQNSSCSISSSQSPVTISTQEENNSNSNNTAINMIVSQRNQSANSPICQQVITPTPPTHEENNIYENNQKVQNNIESSKIPAPPVVTGSRKWKNGVKPENNTINSDQNQQQLLSPFTINMEQRTYYMLQFRMLCGMDWLSCVRGDQARTLFTKSDIPVRELSKIWELSDTDRDGQLNLIEFCYAFHLVVLRKKYQIALPNQLPDEMINSLQPLFKDLQKLNMERLNQNNNNAQNQNNATNFQANFQQMPKSASADVVNSVFQTTTEFNSNNNANNSKNLISLDEEFPQPATNNFQQQTPIQPNYSQQQHYYNNPPNSVPIHPTVPNTNNFQQHNPHHTTFASFADWKSVANNANSQNLHFDQDANWETFSEISTISSISLAKFPPNGSFNIQNGTNQGVLTKPTAIRLTSSKISAAGGYNPWQQELNKLEEENNKKKKVNEAGEAPEKTITAQEAQHTSSQDSVKINPKTENKKLSPGNNFKRNNSQRNSNRKRHNSSSSSVPMMLRENELLNGSELHEQKREHYRRIAEGIEGSSLSSDEEETNTQTEKTTQISKNSEKSKQKSNSLPKNSKLPEDSAQDDNLEEESESNKELHEDHGGDLHDDSTNLVNNKKVQGHQWSQDGIIKNMRSNGSISNSSSDSSSMLSSQESDDDVGNNQNNNFLKTKRFENGRTKSVEETPLREDEDDDDEEESGDEDAANRNYEEEEVSHNSVNKNIDPPPLAQSSTVIDVSKSVLPPEIPARPGSSSSIGSSIDRLSQRLKNTSMNNLATFDQSPKHTPKRGKIASKNNSVEQLSHRNKSTDSEGKLKGV